LNWLKVEFTDFSKVPPKQPKPFSISGHVNYDIVANVVNVYPGASQNHLPNKLTLKHPECKKSIDIPTSCERQIYLGCIFCDNDGECCLNIKGGTSRCSGPLCSIHRIDGNVRVCPTTESKSKSKSKSKDECLDFVPSGPNNYSEEPVDHMSGYIIGVVVAFGVLVALISVIVVRRYLKFVKVRNLLQQEIVMD
jgi:hypothetical protein